jgi:hypothetical protein
MTNPFSAPNYSIVWISTGEVRFFHFSEERMTRDRSIPDFELIFEKIKGSQRILILGNDDSKNQFRDWISKERHDLFSKIVGVESSLAWDDQTIANIAHNTFLKPVS